MSEYILIITGNEAIYQGLGSSWKAQNEVTKSIALNIRNEVGKKIP